MIYHRFNNQDTPYNDTVLMMFAADQDSVEHFGENHWILDTSNLATIAATDDKFTSAMREWLMDNIDYLRGNGYLVDDEGFIDSLIDLANPSDIGDSAGFWDCDDIMACFIDEVINPNGWWIIETQDGAVCFEPDFIHQAK